MNAVADDAAVPRARKVHGLDKAAMEHSLQNWGNWIEQRLDYEGYPRSDAVAAALGGFGGGSRGHRILCLVMPDRLWSVHQRILRLPEHEHAAVVVWYVPAARVEPPRRYSVYPTTLDHKGDWTRWHIHERGGSRVCTDEVFLTADQAETRMNALIREDVKVFGKPWSTLEKAQRLGCSEDALYKRLERARLRLLGVLPLFVGIDRQSEVK